MAIKTVIKMKIKLAFYLILFYNYSYGQTINPINLSYNYVNERRDIQKVEKINNINFYIKNEHFISFRNKNNPQVLNKNNLKNIKVIEIESFLDLACIEKEKKLNNERQTGVVKVLTKDKIFKKILLYVKEKKMILRYEIFWIEEIE